MEQLGRLRMVARCDLAHVPDDGPLQVEVGRADEQDAPAPVFGSDRAQEFPIDIAGDDPGQLGRIGERSATQQAGKNLGRQKLRRAVLGPYFCELPVVGGTEKREGRDDGARADARDDLELRPRAVPAPAGEQTRAEGAVRPATGQGQVFDDRAAVDRPGVRGVGDEIRELAADLGDDVARNLVAEKSRGRKIRDNGRFSHCRVWRGLPRQRRGTSGN